LQTKESTSQFSQCLPSGFAAYCRMKASQAQDKPKEPEYFTVDKSGRLCITKESLVAKHNREAVARHGNDPIKRFDEWGFPGTPQEREFLLNHDFGSVVKESLTTLKNGGWVYAFGEVGNGKTALAMRAVWEFLKDRPSEKASFISMNQYSLDQIRRENSEAAAYRRGEEVYSENLSFRKIVILDDLDKVNYGNDHKCRTILQLIEGLKRGNYAVFATSQISLGDLYRRFPDQFDMKPLVDRLRQMCLVLPEFKGKSHRRFGYP